jgi:hypothetical protein
VSESAKVSGDGIDDQAVEGDASAPRTVSLRPAFVPGPDTTFVNEPLTLEQLRVLKEHRDQFDRGPWGP